MATGRVEIGQSGRGAVEQKAPDKGIEAPFLQLVMRRLWDEEQAAGSRVLRLRTFRALGGAEQIVRDHLDRALGALSARDKDIAAAVFNYLVTPSGTKIAHDAADLARYADVREDELDPVLSTLTQERILRPTAADDGRPRFEMYHDVLGDGVLAWRAEHERARELEENRAQAAQRHRRLLAVIGAGGVLLALMAGVTVFALVQRSDARAHAREADARQLGTSAVSLLEQDPQLSLQLARRAVRLVPSREAEAILRASLLAARERAVLHAGDAVTAAHYSRDGTNLVTGSLDGRARVYDARTHALLRTLDHKAPIRDARFSGDGRMIVTAGDDGKARLWNASDGTLEQTLSHGDPIRSASFDSATTRLVTAGGRGAKLWSLDGGRVATLPWKKPVLGASFSPDGRRIAVFGREPVARLYSTATGTLERSFDQGGPVTSVAFSRERGLLVTTGVNETARIWRVDTGALVHELRGHTGQVLDAAFSPRAWRVATAGADGTARIWDVLTGALAATISGHKNLVTKVAFSPDGNFVATASSDRTARVSKSDTGDARALLAGHRDSVNDVEFSPDGSAVVTAGDDATARIWDPWTQPQLQPLARFPGPIAKAEYVPPGNVVLVAGPGRKARLVRCRERAHSAHIDRRRSRTDGGRGLVRITRSDRWRTEGHDLRDARPSHGRARPPDNRDERGVRSRWTCRNG